MDIGAFTGETPDYGPMDHPCTTDPEHQEEVRCKHCAHFIPLLRASWRDEAQAFTTYMTGICNSHGKAANEFQFCFRFDTSVMKS